MNPVITKRRIIFWAAAVLFFALLPFVFTQSFALVSTCGTQRRVDPYRARSFFLKEVCDKRARNCPDSTFGLKTRGPIIGRAKLPCLSWVVQATRLSRAATRRAEWEGGVTVCRADESLRSTPHSFRPASGRTRRASRPCHPTTEPGLGLKAAPRETPTISGCTAATILPSFNLPRIEGICYTNACDSKVNRRFGFRLSANAMDAIAQTDSGALARRGGRTRTTLPRLLEAAL